MLRLTHLHQVTYFSVDQCLLNQCNSIQFICIIIAQVVISLLPLKETFSVGADTADL